MTLTSKPSPIEYTNIVHSSKAELDSDLDFNLMLVGQIQGGILIAISGALEEPLEGGEKVHKENHK